MQSHLKEITKVPGWEPVQTVTQSMLSYLMKESIRRQKVSWKWWKWGFSKGNPWQCSTSKARKNLWLKKSFHLLRSAHPHPENGWISPLELAPSKYWDHTTNFPCCGAVYTKQPPSYLSASHTDFPTAWGLAYVIIWLFLVVIFAYAKLIN